MKKYQEVTQELMVVEWAARRKPRGLFGIRKRP
jgi:hypothetical protein